MSDSQWSIGQTEHDGAVSICCFRTDVSAKSRKALPNQFIVEWRFTNLQKNGLPVGDEYKLATEFQNEIRETLQAEGDALLAMISTGNGYREWYFYCVDAQAVAKRFNDVVNGRDLPLQLHAGVDPAWKVYHTFVSPFT